jgi:FkbM family methyltransferase
LACSGHRRPPSTWSTRTSRARLPSSWPTETRVTLPWPATGSGNTVTRSGSSASGPAGMPGSGRRVAQLPPAARYDARVDAAFKYRLLRHPHVYTASRRGLLLARYLLRRPHEEDFRAFKDFDRRGLFLDVGANSGASALSFHIFRPECPIVSIEPSAGHIVDLLLVQKIVGNMRFICAAAGERPGILDLHVPYYNGIPMSEFASLDERAVAPQDWNIRHLLEAKNVDASRYEVRREQTSVLRLDDLSLEPAFVKVDVQGFELQVLRGLESTVRKFRPILLVEVNGSSDLLGYVRSLNYRPYAYTEGSLQESSSLTAQNLFMLPD